MFLDGIVSATRRRESDAGEHQYERNPDDGEAGFGLDDYSEPPGCSGESSGSGCGDFPEICGGGGEGMSGVEGAERENFDDGEAGVRSGFRASAFSDCAF